MSASYLERPPPTFPIQKNEIWWLRLTFARSNCSVKKSSNFRFHFYSQELHPVLLFIGFWWLKLELKWASATNIWHVLFRDRSTLFVRCIFDKVVQFLCQSRQKGTMIKSGSDQRFSSNHDQLLMKNQIFW